MANAAASRDEIYERIERLRGILNNSLGLIELNADLDVETVSEIFVRINSQGVPLNAADFAMSKMAANEKYNGHQLRKCIDYFCHLAIVPEAYGDLARDSEFAGTKYFQAMEWLKHEKEDLYDPSYTDMLRVAFTLRVPGVDASRTLLPCSPAGTSRPASSRRLSPRRRSAGLRRQSCAL